MRPLRPVLAGLACLALLVVLPAAPALAVTGSCESIGTDTTDTDPVRSVAPPLDSMGIAEFQRRIEARGVPSPGQGVGVAVVDSGIAPGPGLRTPVPLGIDAAKSRAEDWHGTAVAGLIAGAPLAPGKPVGIAPGATLVDAHFYDVGNDEEASVAVGDDGVPVTTPNLVTALRQVATQVAAEHIRVVNVSVAVPSSRRLEHAVRALTSRGVVVVASSGNRPEEGDYPAQYAGTPQYGEDAARDVFPAGYSVDDPLVLAVGSTVGGDAADDPLSQVLANSAIDLAAPTADGVTYSLNGQSCELGPVAATSWSAAEVSGLLAALMSAFPHDSTQEVVSRLEATTAGLPAASGVPSDRFTGRGVVQPLEALDRHLEFDRHGMVVTSSRPADVVRPAALPTPEPDVLRSTRHHALWWGLAGGGALLIAVTLRPVLARRRR